MAEGHPAGPAGAAEGGAFHFRPKDPGVLGRKVDPVTVLDPATGHILGSIATVSR